MIAQTHRLTRARIQLEQMGRTNCLPREPTRIPRSETQSIAVIERTRLGGALPGPVRLVPATTIQLQLPSTGLWLVHTPPTAPHGEAAQPGDDSPPADGPDSDYMNLIQTTSLRHGGGFSPTVAPHRIDTMIASPAATKPKHHISHHPLHHFITLELTIVILSFGYEG